MRKIKTEIEQYLSGPDESDGNLTSRFIFPQEFTGFQGHFPAKKVLPGACQIQCVLTTIEKGLQRELSLKEIVMAKYFSPVLPDEEIVCTVRGAQDQSGELIVKADLTKVHC